MIPKVSVLMSVYNGESYLSKSIESILNQTFKNFEFIIINDGSTDNSLKIIRLHASKDSRIKLISRSNKGLAVSLNEGIKASQGTYIARQDADDISKKDRLQKQLTFMEKNLDVGLLGTNYSVIDADDKELFSTDVFTHSSDLKIAEVFVNQFGHGSVMMRKNVVELVGGYKDRLAEDYDLWTRIMRECKVSNLKEVLYYWRSTGEGLSTDPEKMSNLRKDAYSIRDREFTHFKSENHFYKWLSFHPKSTRGGAKSYFYSKSQIFRDMAIMYYLKDYPNKAMMPAILALIYYPTSKSSWGLLKHVIFKQGVNEDQYEFF